MPLPALYPLPPNPTTGQQSSLSAIGTRGTSATPSSSGGVNREVLKGLQDAAWSDDEDDPDCLLCAEPLDLSDLNFKPCQCGMQICQFCYNKLLSDDPRCPGCRRTYDAKAVVFQAVDFDEVKRAKEKKTRRAKTIKQLESAGRRHLLGVRIVMKNMVYVVGMKMPAQGDDAIPILRSNDYFGQYGKISKLFLRDRTAISSTSVPTLTSDNPSTSTGIYITYVRREDAARAISSLDGIQAPQGPPGQVLRASYGTTRYCDFFLRGMKCDTSNCNNLHEWGGEGDCFTKDDLETALTKPQEYDARQKQAQQAPPALTSKTAWPKPAAEEVTDATALPRAAQWGVRPVTRTSARAAAPIGSARPKIGNLIPLGSKNNAAYPLPTPSPVAGMPPKVEKEKRKTPAATLMTRGRSGSSTQSTAASSAQTSPKKKVLVLGSAGSTKTAPSSSSTPPISSGSPRAAASEGITPVDEAATSQAVKGPAAIEIPIPTPSMPEAGPSTIASLPETPRPVSQVDSYPQYPVFSAFPSYQDPYIGTPLENAPFEYPIKYTEQEIQRHLIAFGGEFPFISYDERDSGIPRKLTYPSIPARPASPYTGSFQPFDGQLSPPASTSVAISSTTTNDFRKEEESSANDPQKSRFGFAKGNSERGRSPYGSVREQSQNGWMGRSQNYGSTENYPPQNPPVGSLGSSSTEAGWSNEPSYMASPSYNRQQSGFAAFPDGISRQLLQRDDRERSRQDMSSNHQMMGPKTGRDREELDPAISMMQFSNAQPMYGQVDPRQHAQQRIFSPDNYPSRSLHDDYHPSPLPYNHNQYTPPTQDHSARLLQQQYQQRAPSPSPLASHAPGFPPDFTPVDDPPKQVKASLFAPAIQRPQYSPTRHETADMTNAGISPLPPLAVHQSPSDPTPVDPFGGASPIKPVPLFPDLNSASIPPHPLTSISAARSPSLIHSPKPVRPAAPFHDVEVAMSTSSIKGPVEYRKTTEVQLPREQARPLSKSGPPSSIHGKTSTSSDATVTEEGYGEPTPKPSAAILQAAIHIEHLLKITESHESMENVDRSALPDSDGRWLVTGTPESRVDDIAAIDEEAFPLLAPLSTSANSEARKKIVRIPTTVTKVKETLPTSKQSDMASIASTTQTVSKTAVKQSKAKKETYGPVMSTPSRGVFKQGKPVATADIDQIAVLGGVPSNSAKAKLEPRPLATPPALSPASATKVSRAPSLSTHSPALSQNGSVGGSEDRKAKEKRKPGGKYKELVEPAPLPLTEHAGFAPRKKEKAYKPPVIKPPKAPKVAPKNAIMPQGDALMPSTAASIAGEGDDRPLEPFIKVDEEIDILPDEGVEYDEDEGEDEDEEGEAPLSLAELVAHIRDTVDPGSLSTFFSEPSVMSSQSPPNVSAWLRNAVKAIKCAYGSDDTSLAKEQPDYEIWLQFMRMIMAEVAHPGRDCEEDGTTHEHAGSSLGVYNTYKMVLAMQFYEDALKTNSLFSQREAVAKYVRPPLSLPERTGRDTRTVEELQRALAASRQEEMALATELAMVQRENMELWDEARCYT
ncbi:CCR4-NOT transcription complex subunit 4, partial [Tremellales sp. Uapishka_1]